MNFRQGLISPNVYITGRTCPENSGPDHLGPFPGSKDALTSILICQKNEKALSLTKKIHKCISFLINSLYSNFLIKRVGAK